MYQAPEPIKEKYLYPVLEGKTGWSMCFTEPGAGSDLAGIKTTAVHEGDHWVINGRKMWHTGHSGASYTAVAAVTDPSRGARGISIFLVDHGSPGFEKVRDIPVLYRSWGIEEEVLLDNVVVPEENLLGEAGGGFAIAQHQFNRFRLRLGGTALGMSERSQQLAVEYAKEREVFGQTLGVNQAIQWMLTDNQYDIESIRWNTYYAAWLVDRGGFSAARLQASMVKGYCIDAGLRVIDRAMQILGGRGLAIDDYPFGDFYAFLRMCKQMEGSTEIMKITMAREILGKRV
jgi:alkylation response protein AidB-like acyl-CoA dehydrogenase